MTGASALEIRGLAKTFPGVRALRGVDLTVAAGSVHAILGHNGSGKSTLVKVLAGVHTPDPGAQASVFGEALVLGQAESAESLGVRFVHQDLGLVLELSASDNFGFVAGFQRGPMGLIGWTSQAKRTARLLRQFGFDLDPSMPMAEATPAERTAVAITRAVAGWEKGRGLIVLDEPTASLPAREVEDLFRLIRQIRDSGTAVMLVSHRLDEVIEIADHATVLRDGQVAWDGSTKGMTVEKFVHLVAGTSDFVEARPKATHKKKGDLLLRAKDLAGDDLRGVSLDLHEGEVVGVAGLLGSGRDELPYVISGAKTAGITGTFEIDGVEHDSMSIATAQGLGIAFLPADRGNEGIIGPFSVSENVTVATLGNLATRGFFRPSSELRFAQQWLENVEANPAVASAPITTLSGGNQQKALLARGLSVHPRALVIAEPTAGIDVVARTAIYEQIRKCAEEGLALLIASSDVDDLIAVCDRILILNKGVMTGEAGNESAEKTAIIAAMEGVDDYARA